MPASSSAILNVCLNARDAMPRGGVTVSARSELARHESGEVKRMVELP
jgi:hypothetical protein